MMTYFDLNNLGIKHGAFTRGRKNCQYLSCLFFSWVLVLLCFSTVYPQKLFVRSQEYFFGFNIGPTHSYFTDINADSQSDLIITYREPGDVLRSPPGAIVFVNIGKGQLRQAGKYESDWEVGGISLGDINGDGRQDFVMLGGDSLYVLLNNGGESFLKHASGWRDLALACADMDNDGDVDWVIVTGRQDTTLAIQFNDGAGHFIHIEYYQTNVTYKEFPSSPITVDLDKDFDLDVVVLNTVNDSTGSVTVLLNNGDGTLVEWGKFSLGGGGEPRAPIAADLNRDGLLDLIIANGYPGGFSVLFQDSSQTFSQAVFYPSARGYYNIATGDFDKDGDADLAAINDSLRIFENNNSEIELAEVHNARALFEQGESLSVSAGDIDNDGDIDLVTTSNVSRVVSIFLNAAYSTSVGNDDIASVSEFGLNQNYPNPFNAQTRINFYITEASKVSLKVYDIGGREVISLLDQELDWGNYKIAWDGKNKQGNVVVSGVYFYRLQAKNKKHATALVSIKKMLLIR